MRLGPEDWGYNWAVRCLHAAEEINKIKDVGYELCIKGELLLFLAALVGRTGDLPPAATPDTRRLKTVVQLVNEGYAGALHVTDAAAACGCSPSHFMRWFKKMTGQGFTEYLNEHRLNAAADAAAAAAVATVVAADEAALADTSIILFDYSMSVLTPQEKTRLVLIAEQIKSGSKDAVYQIVGHADQQTGTAAGNKRVAEHRAKRVYDFLVSKGVNPKQLNYEGKGNSPDPFKKVQAANRAAIIQ